MNAPNLYADVEIRTVGTLIAAALNTDNNSTRIDMANYEGVIFIAEIDDSVATGVATIKVEQNTADSDSGMTALSGATAVGTCAINDDLNSRSLVVSVHRPKERYLQLVRTSATANIAFGSVIAILYGRRTLPAPLHTSVIAAANVISPDEV